MLMNEYDIDDAVRRWSYDPVLGPAARTLRNLRNAVNRNSDGWAYWRKPSNASKKLQELVSRGNQRKPGDPITRDELKAAYAAALTPVKRFRTTSGIHFEIEEVRA